MGRQLSEEEVRRFNREIKGHLKDKDRERRKRKLAGETVAGKGRTGAAPARGRGDAGKPED